MSTAAQPGERAALWSTPALTGLAFAILAGVVFTLGDGVSLALGLRWNLVSWLGGGALFSMLLALLLSRNGLAEALRPGAPFTFAIWMALRAIALLSLFYGTITPNDVWLPQVVVPFVLLLLAVDRGSARPTWMVIVVAVIVGAAFVAFNLSDAERGVIGTSVTFGLMLMGAITTVSFWVFVPAVVFHLFLAQRLGRTRSVAPLLFWDGVATGLTLLALALYDFDRLPPLELTAFVVVGCLLAVGRALFYRIFVLAPLAYVAVGQLMIIGSQRGSDMAQDLLGGGLDATRSWAIVVIFTLPCLLVALGVVRHRQERRDMAQIFD